MNSQLVGGKLLLRKEIEKEEFLSDFRKSNGGKLWRRENGAIASVENGEVTAYPLGYIQEEEVTCKAGDRVYRGTIIGKYSKEVFNLSLNSARGKS